MENQGNQRVVFLEGKKVILRPLDKEKDLGVVLKWANDPELRQFVSFFLPSTKKQEEEWFDKKREDEIVLAIETKEGEFIGSIGLHKINYRHRTAITGTLIGEKSFWGKGYGTDAKMILLNYAFNTLNLRKIKSQAYATNQRSVNYSKKCGYKVEGILKKDLFVNGDYVDVVCLAVFRKSFKRVWRNYQQNGPQM
jgi:RimJ/RimL family protein N-acetyltransferase